ncbi:MAG: spermidine synthase, partial [Planctomycetota bacterium]
STASAIAAHETVESIDVVDLNEKVIETAGEFAEATNNVHRDPRIRFIVDDGRSFLKLSEDSYDLITSEPPPPMQAGIYRLYTREYYRQVLDHLTPDGMMTQWLPTYQMPMEAIELAVRTFVDVFPHALVFAGGHREFILMGSRAPIDLRRLEQRFYEQPAVTADLRRMRILKPLSLIARVVQGDATLRRNFGEGRVLGDTHNDLDFLFHDPADREVFGYDPIAMMTDIHAGRLACGDELRDVLTHLGRLRYHVPRYPTSTLLRGRDAVTEGVKLADVDWSEVIHRLEPISELQTSGRHEEAFRALQQVLDMAPEQPLVLLNLAAAQLGFGNTRGAFETLQEFRHLEPNAEIGERMLGQALWRQGRHNEAITALRRAVKLDPYSPDAQHALGDRLVASGNLEAGIDHLLRALELDPERDGARRALNIAREKQKAGASADNPAP